MALSPELDRLERAMERLGRIGRSPQAAAARASMAGIAMPGAAQRVLRAVIEHGPIRVSEVARRVDVGDAAASRLITTLEAAGLAKRAASPDDGRVQMVSPTPAGRAAARKLRRAADRIFESRLDGWSDRELSNIAGLMERLAGDLAKENGR